MLRSGKGREPSKVRRNRANTLQTRYSGKPFPSDQTEACGGLMDAIVDPILRWRLSAGGIERLLQRHTNRAKLTGKLMHCLLTGKQVLALCRGDIADIRHGGVQQRVINHLG